MQLSNAGTYFVAFSCFALSPLFTQDSPHQGPDALKSGMVVEKVDQNSEAEKAGIKEEDILLNWRRGDAQGEIQSPFDLTAIEIEQAPRGTVTLDGLRGAEKKTWTLGPDGWGVEARPAFSKALLATYSEGRELATLGKRAQAEERWRAIAAQENSHTPPWLRPWLLLHIAKSQAEARQWKESDQTYQQSIESAATAGPEVQTQLLRAWAKTFEQRVIWAEAEKYYQQAFEKEASLLDNLGGAMDLDNLGVVARSHGDLTKAENYHLQGLQIREKLAPGSLAVAWSFYNLGRLEDERGGLVKAENYYRQSLAIRERLAPGGLDVAAALNNLGNSTIRRGDLATSEAYYRRALEIKERLAPGSITVAASLNNLGMVEEARGELTRAEEHFSQALEIRERLAPGSLYTGAVFNNLGDLALYRGDLHKAEVYFRRSAELEEKFHPGSLDLAIALENLGLVCWRQGDFVRAEEYGGRTLEIREKLAPGSLEVAESIDNLGLLALDRGDVGKAEEYHERALILRQQLAPNSLSLASSLDNLGVVAARRGDLPKAEEYLLRALAVREKLAPGGGDTAGGLNRLGAAVKDRGDLDRAEQYYRRALGIWEKIAPRSANQADALAGLASIARQRGQLGVAAQLYEQALNALEGQTARLGGTEEVRAGFRAKHEDYYREYIDLLVSQNQPELAFTVLERSRARTLLETLATAHVDIRKGADPQLVARERSLQVEIKAKSEHRVRLLGDKHTDEQIKAIENEIGNQISEYQDVEAQIRSGSPVFAALTQPQPLSAKEVQQQLLDPDTLLLEYSLGEERSYVFAVTQDSLQAFPLPRRTEIEDAAQRIYGLLTVPNRRNKDETPGQRQQRIVEAQAKYPKTAAQLGRMLLGPVASLLKDKRLVIVSDGALHYVPFAALLMARPGRLPALLVSQNEIINLPSASVLSLLRQQQASRKPVAGTVAVVADPVFDKDDVRVKAAAVSDPRENAKATSGDHDLAGREAEAGQSSPSDDLARAGADVDWERKPSGELFLPRLRYTRQEADVIVAMAPAGQTLEALDFKASRDTATNPELANYRIVHLATHALFNNKHPELSGLVLSLVDEGGSPRNGFLGLEDIYNLDLPVDMVVLSACETGLGKKIEGEGLVGLTRGFMYAGANRIVASLWSVGDRATAELMGNFYRSMLKEGLRPAAALRRAQLQMLQQQRWSSPYFWAAFQIQGEWK